MRTLTLYATLFVEGVLEAKKMVITLEDSETIAQAISTFEKSDEFKPLYQISNNAVFASTDGENKLTTDISKFFVDKSKTATKDEILSAIETDQKGETVVKEDKYEDMKDFVKATNVEAQAKEAKKDDVKAEDLEFAEKTTKEAVNKMSDSTIKKLYKAVRGKGGKDFYSTLIKEVRTLSVMDIGLDDLHYKMVDFASEHNTKDAVKVWDKICAFSALIFTKLATVILGLGKFLIDTTVILGVMVGRIATYTVSEAAFAGMGIGKAFNKDLIQALK